MNNELDECWRNLCHMCRSIFAICRFIPPSPLSPSLFSIEPQISCIFVNIQCPTTYHGSWTGNDGSLGAVSNSRNLQLWLQKISQPSLEFLIFFVIFFIYVLMEKWEKVRVEIVIVLNDNIRSIHSIALHSEYNRISTISLDCDMIHL